MVARVLFPVLTCGATRSHPQHRATIKALPASPHLPRPYGYIPLHGWRPFTLSRREIQRGTSTQTRREDR